MLTACHTFSPMASRQIMVDTNRRMIGMIDRLRRRGPSPRARYTGPCPTCGRVVAVDPRPKFVPGGYAYFAHAHKRRAGSPVWCRSGVVPVERMVARPDLRKTTMPPLSSPETK